MTLGDLLRDPRDREATLACVPLVVRSAAEVTVMPKRERPLRLGDEILFCGSPQSHRLLEGTIENEYSLHYTITGVDPPRGFIMRWIDAKVFPASAANGSAAPHGPLTG